MKPIYEKINKQEDQSFFVEEVNRPHFTDLWHFHPEIEILYIREGYGTKYVGDSINSYFPGDIVIIGSNTPHVWSSDPEYVDAENNLLTIGICIQFMDNFIEKIPLSIPELKRMNEFLTEAKRGIQFSQATRSILINLLEGIPSRIGMDRLIGLLTILNVMATSKNIKYLSSPNYQTETINSADKDRMEIIFRYVIQNYPKKIFIDEVASLVNLSAHSFCRYFKSRTTKVFAFFVNEVRVGNACKLLIENKYSISQVCFQTGFNYLSNFNRQFKKIKGITPSEFQRNYKNNKFDMVSDN
jgi:AraC-like DNA-binding protein